MLVLLVRGRVLCKTAVTRSVKSLSVQQIVADEQVFAYLYLERRMMFHALREQHERSVRLHGNNGHISSGKFQIDTRIERLEESGLCATVG